MTKTSCFMQLTLKFISSFITAEIARVPKSKGSLETALTFLHITFVIAKKCVMSVPILEFLYSVTTSTFLLSLSLSLLLEGRIPYALLSATVQVGVPWIMSHHRAICHPIRDYVPIISFRTHKTSVVRRCNTYSDSTKKDHFAQFIPSFTRLGGVEKKTPPREEHVQTHEVPMRLRGAPLLCVRRPTVRMREACSRCYSLRLCRVISCLLRSASSHKCRILRTDGGTHPRRTTRTWRSGQS